VSILQPVPHAIFSYPQIGSVGKTEQELKEDGTTYVKAFAPPPPPICMWGACP
jgi:pyruvate/2-oxoglutarate dehydrogenase complex dihydrolipoamide dehydrogenase (E3) component